MSTVERNGLVRMESVNAVITQTLQNWVAKSSAYMMGKEGPAELQPYQYRDKKGKVREEMAFIGSSEEDYQAQLAAEEIKIPGGLPKGEAAKELQPRLFGPEWAKRTAWEVYKPAKKRLLKAAKSAVMRYIKETVKLKSFRSKKMAFAVQKIMDGEVAAAVEKLKGLVAEPRLRTGPQVISTSRTKAVPQFGFLEFSGKPAYRQFQGRPVLPESVWLSRYEKRLKKRRVKGGYKSPGFKRKVRFKADGTPMKARKRPARTRRQGPQVPKSKFPRPPFLVNLKHG